MRDPVATALTCCWRLKWYHWTKYFVPNLATNQTDKVNLPKAMSFYWLLLFQSQRTGCRWRAAASYRRIFKLRQIKCEVSKRASSWGYRVAALLSDVLVHSLCIGIILFSVIYSVHKYSPPKQNWFQKDLVRQYWNLFMAPQQGEAFCVCTFYSLTQL